MNFFKIVCICCVAPTFIGAEIINFCLQVMLGLPGWLSHKLSWGIASLLMAGYIYFCVPAFLPQSAPLDVLDINIEVHINFSIWGLMRAWVYGVGVTVISCALITLRVTWYILSLPAFTYFGVMMILWWLY